MKKEFTVSIKDEFREVNPKSCYLTGEDKRNVIDIFNNFLETIDGEQNETIIEHKLNAMARAIISNTERNKICDEHEEEIANMISCLLENICIEESFTANSIGKLDWHYCDIYLFNAVVKRLIQQGFLIEKRMAKRYTYKNTYVKVYTRIK